MGGECKALKADELVEPVVQLEIQKKAIINVSFKSFL